MHDSLAKPWLALQCQMIPHVTRAAVMPGPGSADSQAPTACWPEDLDDTTELAAAGRLAIDKGGAIAQARKNGNGQNGVQHLIVACPLTQNGQLLGAAAVEVEADSNDPQRRRAVIQLLEWGAAWLGFRMQDGPQSAAAGRLAAVMEITTACLEHRRFQAAATAAATYLAGALGCERVSLGFLERGHMRVKALSHTAQLERRSNLMREVEAAMDEALDEGAAVVFPPLPSTPPQGVAAHERLHRGADQGSVCTVPLSAHGEALGAMTFERTRGTAFDAAAVDFCAAIAALLGPVLDIKRREDRWIGAKMAEAAGDMAGRVFGPGHLRTKLATSAALVLIGVLALSTGQYRVAGTAVLEGTEQRTLVAPVDGYIASAKARAGDVVKAGRVLATLDTRELELERRRWASERAELVKQHRRAIGQLDRAQAKILQAQIGKAQAKLALVDEQLARTQLVAPFEGIIVSGDLSQSLGAPVERGQVLFELAPLDGYRMALQVDEADIADVIPGQAGHLALASLPGERFPFVVERIVGLAETFEGRNVFRVEGRLDGASPMLRPGMKGVGKIEVEERKLLWVWTHGTVQRLQLWLWSHLP